MLSIDQIAKEGVATSGGLDVVHFLSDKLADMLEANFSAVQIVGEMVSILTVTHETLHGRLTDLAEEFVALQERIASTNPDSN